MEITITKKEDRPLLRRSEVTAQISFEGATPTKHEAAAAVAKATGAKKELVIVRSITTHYGTTTGTLKACVYKDAQALEELELESMRKRHAAKEAEKPAPAEKNPAEKKEETEEKEETQEEPAEKQTDSKEGD
ncbi:hypothetical protein D6789_02020 [Candidatus Woesearchaeota archaeon]|nr:MAG: hypothetical protein D6789_02020 [Candidatus Woesearchaeota archaeon]